MYRNRSSRNLFSVMRHLLKKRGTLYEPGKYNFLLLILFYLLSFSHNSMMHKNVQGESNPLLPTKHRTLLTKTFSDICSNSKYRNVCQVTKSLLLTTYIIRGNSKYRDVCQTTKSLLLATYILWGRSKYQNVCKFSNIAQMQPRPLPSTQGISSQKRGGSSSRNLAVSKISDFISEGSSSRNLAVSKTSNFIHNIQWPSNKHATSQEKVTKFKIQWPPEKVATMQTMANSN